MAPDIKDIVGWATLFGVLLWHPCYSGPCLRRGINSTFVLVGT